MLRSLGGLAQRSCFEISFMVLRMGLAHLSVTGTVTLEILGYRCQFVSKGLGEEICCRAILYRSFDKDKGTCRS